jgi:transposase, IS6 family
MKPLSKSKSSGCTSTERLIRKEIRSISSSVRHEMRQLPKSSCSKPSPPLIPARHACRALDKNAASPKAFNELQASGVLSEEVELRQIKYLNNIVEQDHRFIKRLTKPAMGFFTLETAWQTLQGFEVMNMIRKGPVQGVDKGDVKGQAALVAKFFGLVA